MMKPILFNTEMVQAILDGRKTVTRRIIKPQPKMRLCYTSAGSHNVGKWEYPSPNTYKYWGDEWRLVDGITDEDLDKAWTPPCHTDDILYVRETWAYLYPDEVSDNPCGFLYKADREGIYGDKYKRHYDAMYPEGRDWTWKGIWKPSIHMPKEAARLFLRVTHVDIGRLQDMAAQDSLNEGVKLSLDGIIRKGEPALARFAEVWDSTITQKDLPIYGWDANPFVWIVDFKQISREEAML